MIRLKELRLNAGITQRELSARSGCTISAISAMENGKRVPRTSTAQRLASALGCGVNDLLSPVAPKSASGYQQGILLALGSLSNDGRFRVRHKDRFYPDAVQPLFGTNVFFMEQAARPSGYWVVRSSKLRPPELGNVTDWKGFCRAWIEIHSSLVPITQHVWKRGVRHIPGLKIYGSKEIVEAVMDHLPITPKKIQHISHSVDGGKYTGRTYCLTLQKNDTASSLAYIDGFPRNDAVWDSWAEKIARVNSMDSK